MNWLRFIFSVFALCGLLVAGGGGAMAAKAHHHCCPTMAAEMAQDHHHGQADGRGAAPKCCVFGLCAVPAALAESQGYVSAPRPVVRVSFLPFDLAGPLSRTTSPDLRPPIA
ncbi:hypothetical protein QM467_18665 [Rhodoblastus sp. 17X3]|uniref:hypothetical protein n=1 Tax=Rhodoblastus sp. 17X3 TaxID=3047026 RepID=UPI0024B6C008|nr:hypothetical protein [Rhodoblastus sp. 17X3]MDI9850062.1 hypothetical protein [Rhodoblastus sp. 17X3]